MFDILFAVLIARAFGKRARERSDSPWPVGILVAVVILGAEVGVAVAWASPLYFVDRIIAGLVAGWALGALLGTALGFAMTAGPRVRRADGTLLVGGRACAACEREILDEDDGEPCATCEQPIHRRCRAEHAIVHGEAPETSLRLKAATVPGSVVGLACVECDDEIVMRHQGSRCDVCDRVVHATCAGAHEEQHMGPYRGAQRAARL